MKHLPTAPIGELIKDAGANRISADIKEAIGVAMENYGTQLARKAIVVATFRGDVTIKAKHLKLALDMESSQTIR
jgi:histone H3/H4